MLHFQICVYIDFLSEYLKENTDPVEQGQQLNQIQVIFGWNSTLGRKHFLVQFQIDLDTQLFQASFALRNAECSEFRLLYLKSDFKEMEKMSNWSGKVSNW